MLRMLCVASKKKVLAKINIEPFTSTVRVILDRSLVISWLVVGGKVMHSSFGQRYWGCWGSCVLVGGICEVSLLRSLEK